MQERAAIVPAEVLYHSRRDDTHHRVYMHRSEEAMLVTSNQVDRAFIQPESFIQLQRSGMRFLHMGVIQVRIQILHRQEEGTLALIIFRDNRWQGDQSIFATMEVDLTHGSQMVYVIPDTMLTISDFYQNIQVSILTRGYENWQNGEANLLITRGLVGRLSNTPNVGFAYNIQNVVDYLTSHGVRALPGRRYNTRDIQGHNWVIRQSTIRVPMQPTEVNTRNLLDGSISLQFDAYQPATTSSPVRYNSKDEEILSDEEEITNHTIAVLTEETIKTDELLVQRITPTALLPQRKSSGAAGYDIAVDQEYNLKAQKQMSLTTGICIQVPKGTYARIASRSSYALQGVIIMGGVIDTDYRGGVKILAYNSSNDDIYLKKQTYIAQLILERISNPLVREVTLLQNTQRGDQGFGSTTIQVCSKNRANPLCSGCYYCCSDEDCAQEYDFYIQPDKGKTLVSQEEQIERQAQRRHAMQYKSFEEEAYQNLICGPKSLPLTQAARQLRNSREYRQQLQILHSPPLNTESSQSSSSTKFLAVFNTSDTDDNDYLEYLQYLALQDAPSPAENKFTNPFAKGDGDDINTASDDDIIIAAASTSHTKDDWISDYPQLQQLQETIYSQEAASNYQPPADTTMNPVGYPPNRQMKEEPVSLAPPREPRGTFKRKETSEWWNLPTAHQQTGAILTLPTQLNRIEDVFLRWEAITKNVVALQNFADTQDKADFIENLLGEAERLTWIQWRMTYPNEYQELINASEGRNGTYSFHE
ncbi:uncharacterized protein LOC121979346 [Zingiber officinale]|uniref:uncharacterized protein LOC121979346 n=1 Tax=Zingiber officinale TaxID=94328 RepID=UPI001C4AB608|nr:uncharacterized protein LOC121979346 [Zingiber officinale]